MFYAYLIGRDNFMHKEFPSFDEAQESFKRLQSVPHKEKVTWIICERQLTTKEEMVLQATVVEL